jgi:hypothetical protein
MIWLWTWGGICFGYMDADDIWTHDGLHIGKTKGKEISDPQGRYLGEIKSENRLITNKSTKGTRIANGFSPKMHRVGYVRMVNYVGNVMLVGYEDFPPPEAFS